jgi:hypothetical protein
MADAEGYREGDAGGASDEVLRGIIFNKLPLLNSPGELVPNTLYYDAQNSSVQVAECTNFFGRDRIAFNNKSFGSAPTVYIPNVFFNNTSFVVMELDTSQAVYPSDISGAKAKDLGCYLPHGWGFAAIQSIVYYLGSSSVANVTISGVANLLFILGSCETREKKQAVLSGGGKYLNNRDIKTDQHFISGDISETASISPLAAPVADTFVFRNIKDSVTKWSSTDAAWETRNVLDPTLGVATVPIRLPYSSLCALEKRISFDTKLLQQPIQVTLQLKNANSFMELGSNLVTVGGLNKEFKSLSFQSYQQGLSDQSLSLRNELLANPRFSVGYPFQYLQDMRFNVLPSQGGKYFVNITSMLNADLTTIQFALMWDRDQVGGGVNRFSPFAFIEMDNIELLLNGQRLHNYDQDSYKSVYNAHNISPYWPDVAVAQLVKSSSGNEAALGDVRRFTRSRPAAIYEINFSRLRAQIMEAHMMNTPRFTNQTMQLGFTIRLSIDNFDQNFISDEESTNPRLVLHTSYLYNAVFMIGQDGGQSKLVTA